MKPSTQESSCNSRALLRHLEWRADMTYFEWAWEGGPKRQLIYWRFLCVCGWTRKPHPGLCHQAGLPSGRPFRKTCSSKPVPVIPDVCSAALWVTEFTRICALGLGMMLQLFSGDTRGSTQPLRIICSFRWESSDHGGYNFPQQMSKVNTMLLILDSQHFQNKKVLPNIFFFQTVYLCSISLGVLLWM